MDRKTLIYAAATYALFFAFIGLIGVVMLVLQAPPVVVTGLQMAASWTPTLALLLLFATLVPGEKRLRFIRRWFTARPDRRTLLLSVLPLTAILLGTVTTASLVRGEPITELVVLSPLTGSSWPFSTCSVVPSVKNSAGAVSSFRTCDDDTPSSRPRPSPACSGASGTLPCGSSRAIRGPSWCSTSRASPCRSCAATS